MRRALIDTGAIYALVTAADRRHAEPDTHAIGNKFSFGIF